MTLAQLVDPPVGISPRLNVALVGCVDDDSRADGLSALAAALSARGHVVTVHTRYQGKQTLRAADEHGYRVQAHRVGDAAPVSESDALALSGEMAGKLQDAWRRKTPDIVHAYGWLSGVAAQLAASRQRLPTVQSFHSFASPAGSTPDRSRLEAALARQSTWATAESTADVDLLSTVRRNRARVSLMPSGVDAEGLDRADSHESGYRIACLAPNALQLNDVSRVLGVLPALHDTQLVIGETGPPDDESTVVRKALQEFAIGLGVVDRVTFFDHVRADEIPSVLYSADVLACTPTTTPDPAVALVAMAVGVPVVAYDVGALSDVVIHDVTGLLVPQNSHRELVAALKNLQAESFRRQGMGAAGRARARSRYSWDRIAVDAESAYRQVISARASLR